jgi:hypothetical protein
MFVVLYRHRHGEDVFVAQTEDGALRLAAAVAMDFRHEVPVAEYRHRIQATFERDQFSECVSAYNQARDDESIDVHGPLDVHP